MAAFGFEYLYDIPGMEDVEDIIVSSGPNAWPNWRNFSDRIIRPGETRHHRPRRADLERLQVLRATGRTAWAVRPPTSMRRYYDIAHKWL